MHDADVDPVGGEILDDHLGVALRHAPTGLAVTRDRPTLEARCVQPAEDPSPALDEWLDLEVLFPDAAVAQVFGQARLEKIGRFENMSVSGDDKGLVLHVLSLSSGIRENLRRAREAAHPD
jgi:hypothetical protein